MPPGVINVHGEFVYSSAVFIACRHRLQNKDSGAPRQEDKAADMGHGGARALPHHHHVVLPWRHGHHARLRYH